MSRLLGGLSHRVFFAAVVCAGLSSALVMGLIYSVMIDQCLRRVALLTPQFGPLVRSFCARDSQHDGNPLGPDLEITFYDVSTQEPDSPGVPPPDPVLLRRLLAGDPLPSRMYFLSPWGGASMRRLADGGPCSLVQLRWRVGKAERRQGWIFIFGLPALSGAIAVFLTSFFAVRPITLRLRRLRRATQQVGKAAGYASAADPEADDLGQLSLLLDQAHARIATDAERARDRQKALEQHLANVAHDLRTPLASLQLTIERLSDSTQLTIERLADSTKTPSSDLVRSAIDDVVYMGALIGNLYLACRLQDGVDPLYGDPRVDLGMLVEHVTRRFAKVGRSRAIEVHGARPDAPVWTRCNAAMAEQVLANLVHNAVVHGDEGGHVAVLLEVTAGRFTLTVVDDGPGVPPVELPRLGERTFRSDAARQRDPQGGGLGLAITTEVCRRADFSLTFERQEPRGLRVTIAGDCVGLRAAVEDRA